MEPDRRDGSRTFSGHQRRVARRDGKLERSGDVRRGCHLGQRGVAVREGVEGVLGRGATCRSDELGLLEGEKEEMVRRSRHRTTRRVRAHLGIMGADTTSPARDLGEHRYLDGERLVRDGRLDPYIQYNAAGVTCAAFGSGLRCRTWWQLHRGRQACIFLGSRTSVMVRRSAITLTSMLQLRSCKRTAVYSSMKSRTWCNASASDGRHAGLGCMYRGRRASAGSAGARRGLSVRFGG